MSGQLAGKVALVTGGATGIGKAIAVALAAEGAHVVVNHLYTAGKAAFVVADIESAGGSTSAIAANVKGTFNCLQLAWRHLADGGRIVWPASGR